MLSGWHIGIFFNDLSYHPARIFLFGSLSTIYLTAINWVGDHSTQVMCERTWDGVDGKRPMQSSIPAHPSQRHLPDPNDEQDRDAIKYWIKLSDFYQLPHIQHYDSVDDLVNKLNTISMTTLKEISQRMNSFNVQLKDELISKWKTILKKITESSPNRPHWSRPLMESSLLRCASFPWLLTSIRLVQVVNIAIYFHQMILLCLPKFQLLCCSLIHYCDVHVWF